MDSDQVVARARPPRVSVLRVSNADDAPEELDIEPARPGQIELESKPLVLVHEAVLFCVPPPVLLVQRLRIDRRSRGIEDLAERVRGELVQSGYEKGHEVEEHLNKKKF